MAASFLAETEPSLVLETFFGEPLEGNSTLGIAKDGDLVVAVIHVGTGVVDPALFCTKIARLNLYFWINDDDEDDEQPRFLILHTLLPFPSTLWCGCHDIVSYIYMILARISPQNLKLDDPM